LAHEILAKGVVSPGMSREPENDTLQEAIRPSES
jgi:hypothetical protein